MSNSLLAVTLRRLLCCLALMNLFGRVVLAVDQRPPNIVFILADDMGYGDVQALNPQSNIPTPNLNSLARDGMTFTDAHSGSAVCTPTRYGLLTGRYCWRSRLKRGVLNGYSPPLVERDRPTVASFLKSHGYSTGIVGKWHLGLGFVKGADGEIDYDQPITHGPNTLGFDYSYIIPASLDFPPYVYIENQQVVELPTESQPARSFPPFLRKGPRSPGLVMEEVLDHLVAQATHFIKTESATTKPFLLYLPLSAPHKPVLPHPRFRGTTELGPYGDFVSQVDHAVGQVLAAIETAGIVDDTLVIYSSDNASFMYRLDAPDAVDHVTDEKVQAYRADSHTANYQFRGTKADVWEGGHRVPFFVRWPSTVAASTRCAETICLTDFFTTTADILGYDVPQGAAVDSFSLLPLFKQQPWQREPVVNHSAGGMFAIREGNWKLVLGNGSGGRQDPKGRPFEKPYHLFDLSTDIGEANNLIDQYPDIADRLETKLTAIREQESVSP